MARLDRVHDSRVPRCCSRNWSTDSDEASVCLECGDTSGEEQEVVYKWATLLYLAYLVHDSAARKLSLGVRGPFIGCARATLCRMSDIYYQLLDWRIGPDERNEMTEKNEQSRDAHRSPTASRKDAAESPTYELNQLATTGSYEVA